MVRFYLPGVLHLEQRYTSTGFEDNVLVAVLETGYSRNDELHLGWLSHFERYSARRQLGTCRLLLLDGYYGSHCTKEFIQFCDNHKIVLPYLPPHTTRLLQPLGAVVFQPYKHYHAEAATRAGAQPQEDLQHTQVAEIARAARQRSMARRREEEELEKAKEALNRAQRAADRKVIAE